MDIHFGKKQQGVKNEERFDPHRYWIIVLGSFLLALAAVLGYFSWYFVHTATVLDATPTPFLESNAAQIDAMDRRLKTVEDAIAKRSGASQNTSSVVQ